MSLNTKTAFFNKKGANYRHCVESKLRLIPDDELRTALERDYRQMMAEGMFNGKVPEFTAMLDELKELETRINSTLRAT